MKNQSFYSALNKNQKYILFCCLFIFLVNGLFSMMLGSILPLISSEYGLNNTISGGLISAHQVGNLISGFIAGILPVYLGKKKSIIFLCSFVILGFVIMMVYGNPILLLIAFLFTGLSRGSISNFDNSTVNEISGSSPSALSILHSVFAVGAFLSPILVIVSTKIGGEKGWKLATGFIIFLVLISMILFSQMKGDEHIVKQKKSLSYVFLKDKYFWAGTGILFFYLCAEAAITGWLVKYFVDSNIMSISYAQMLNSLLWVVILAGRLVTAFIGNRMKKEKILVFASIGTACFYALLLSTQNLVLITIAIMGLGFSMAGIYPTTFASVGKTISKYPMATGVLLMIGGVGAILMPIITGALSDQFGILAGMSAILIAIILMIVCVIISIYHTVKLK